MLLTINQRSRAPRPPQLPAPRVPGAPGAGCDAPRRTRRPEPGARSRPCASAASGAGRSGEAAPSGSGREGGGTRATYSPGRPPGSAAAGGGGGGGSSSPSSRGPELAAPPRLRVPAAGVREAGRGPLNFWDWRGGETGGDEGGAGRTPMRRQIPPAWGAFSAGCRRQVFASPGMGSGPLFLGGGRARADRGRRTRCRLGPNEGAGAREERKGCPGGASSHPRAAGIDPLCLVRRGAASCPQSAEPGAGGAAAGELRLPCSNSSFPLLGAKLLWGF